MSFVNEARLIRLIGLIIIAEVRLGKCSELAWHQLCSQHKLLAIGCIVDTRLTGVTFLDDKTKIFFSLKQSCYDNKAQGYPFILNPNKPSQISKSIDS